MPQCGSPVWYLPGLSVISLKAIHSSLLFVRHNGLEVNLVGVRGKQRRWGCTLNNKMGPTPG